MAEKDDGRHRFQEPILLRSITIKIENFFQIGIYLRETRIEIHPCAIHLADQGLVPKVISIHPVAPAAIVSVMGTEAILVIGVAEVVVADEVAGETKAEIAIEIEIEIGVEIWIEKETIEICEEILEDL